MKTPPTSFDELYRKNESYYGDSPSDGLVACINKYNIRPCSALDLGCGQGRNGLWLAEQGFDVLALDSSAEGIRELQRNAERRGVSLRAHACDARVADLGERSFGLIVVQSTLNHIPAGDLSGLCTRISNVLAEDGVLYAVVFTTDDPGYRGQSDASDCAGFVEQYFGLGELASLFRDLDVLEYREYRKIDSSHGAPHFHGKAKLIARRSK
jgi:tellurite methyltransferase